MMHEFEFKIKINGSPTRRKLTSTDTVAAIREFKKRYPEADIREVLMVVATAKVVSAELRITE